MRPIGPSFRIAGIEPRGVRSSPSFARRAFWDAVLVFVLEAHDRQTAAGLDRHGVPMRALSVRTIAHRHSDMGPADPAAPPLQPAHGLSRTRSLITGQASSTGVVCWWKHDPHTGGSWGTILGYHAEGAGGLPRRDVLGLSPSSLAEVKRRADAWWTEFRAGNATTPTVTREVYPGGVAPAHLVATPPRYVPRNPASAVPKARRRVSEIQVNGHHYTLQTGSAAQTRRAIANGSYVGPRDEAAIDAELAARGIKRTAGGGWDFSALFGGGGPPAGPASPTAIRPSPPRFTPPVRGGTASRRAERPDQARKPPPARPVFPDQDREELLEIASNILGRPATPRILANLVGAPDGSKVELTIQNEARVHIRVRSARYNSFRELRRNDDETVVIEHAQSKVAAREQGHGIARDVFARQLETAREMGIHYLTGLAARDDVPDPEKAQFGYKVWPKFGFDGPIPWDLIPKLPDGLKGAKLVSDLYKSEAGRTWWEEHGRSVRLQFDMTPGSLSWRTWLAYLASKTGPKP